MEGVRLKGGTKDKGENDLFQEVPSLTLTPAQSHNHRDTNRLKKAQGTLFTALIRCLCAVWSGWVCELITEIFTRSRTAAYGNHNKDQQEENVLLPWEKWTRLQTDGTCGRFIQRVETYFYPFVSGCRIDSTLVTFLKLRKCATVHCRRFH